MYFLQFTPLLVVAFTLSSATILYSPIHWKLNFFDIPLFTISSYSYTLSPAYSFSYHSAP